MVPDSVSVSQEGVDSTTALVIMHPVCDEVTPRAPQLAHYGDMGTTLLGLEVLRRYYKVTSQ